MAKTQIEWADSVWNPTAGCSEVSIECMKCYAKTQAFRNALMGQEKYFETTRKSGGEVKWTGKINFGEAKVLGLPFTWKSPKRIFVNSMSDLFHEKIPLHFIIKIFEIMRSCYWHQFIVLTKRAERMAELSNKLFWADNIWMGVSIGSPKYLARLDCLKQTGAKIKFLSIEPLLEKIDYLDLSGIDWVIVGGESGLSNPRPMEAEWVRIIRDLCIAEDVAFFFKQWGGSNAVKKINGNELDGRKWEEFPR